MKTVDGLRNIQFCEISVEADFSGCEPGDALGDWLLSDFGGRFFIAPFAIDLETDAGSTTLRGQHPRATGHWRIVTQVLSMSARQDRAPMKFVILVEIRDRLLHRSSRT